MALLLFVNAPMKKQNSGIRKQVRLREGLKWWCFSFGKAYLMGFLGQLIRSLELECVGKRKVFCILF